MGVDKNYAYRVDWEVGKVGKERTVRKEKTYSSV